MQKRKEEARIEPARPRPIEVIPHEVQPQPIEVIPHEVQPAQPTEVKVMNLVPMPSTDEAQPYLHRTLGPLTRLTRAWLAESAKLQQIEVDRLHSIIDDSHRLALEGLATFASLGLTMQRGIVDHLDQIEKLKQARTEAAEVGPQGN